MRRGLRSGWARACSSVTSVALARSHAPRVRLSNASIASCVPKSGPVAIGCECEAVGVGAAACAFGPHREM